MANIFELVAKEEYVWDAVANLFRDGIEETFSVEIDDNEANAMSKEIAAKMAAPSNRPGVCSKFGEWFIDNMPTTHALMCECVYDALNAYIEQEMVNKIEKHIDECDKEGE